ncbi:MAG: COX15/CtaA family protein [Hyphomicrobiales bacterium]
MNVSRSTGMGAADRTAPVRVWLYLLCAMIFAMILLGGATRLTDSGLSITEWQLFVGTVPPLNETDWQKAFDAYRQIPEYQLVNKGMSLDAFKFIYWWEWAHRFLGRMIGFAFLLPFLWFWRKGLIDRALMPKLVAMFVLGGAQGALGWYMVSSGLVDRVDVSQYRLAAHLGLAVAIIAYIFWVAIGLRPGVRGAADVTQAQRLSAGGLAALVFLQIIAGAFVAGIDAGMGYNTWPLMEGELIPPGLGAMTPWYLNLFENALTVQFDHRVIAYVIVVWAVLQAVWLRRDTGTFIVAGITLAQAGLGIWTLLAQVPVVLGVTHQAGAVVLLLAALLSLRRMV